MRLLHVIVRDELSDLQPCPSQSQKKSSVCLCVCPLSNLDFWPLQTLCCSPPVSLAVWCSLSQCRASSGASAAAAEPAPTQVQDLGGGQQHAALTRWKSHYTNEDDERLRWAMINVVFKAPREQSAWPADVPLSEAMNLQQLQENCPRAAPDLWTVENYWCQRGPKQYDKFQTILWEAELYVLYIHWPYVLIIIWHWVITK